MTAKECIGGVLVALPFVVICGVSIKYNGVKGTLFVFGVSVAILACIYGGCELLK